MYILIATIVGARLGHCLFYELEYYLKNPIEILMFYKDGLASHGGIIAILIAIMIFAKKFKLPFFWIMDRAVVCAAFTGGCIRTGNLMISEIYGIETDLPWGFIFKYANETVAKHPTQIYEALS